MKFPLAGWFSVNPTEENKEDLFGNTEAVRNLGTYFML